MASPDRASEANSLRARIDALEQELRSLRAELFVLESEARASEASQQGRPPVPPLPVAPPRAPSTAKDEGLEGFVGGKVLATVGGIVLTIAIGALVHLGYRQGWFQVFGPIGRMLGGYVVSAALLALGELVRRRVARLAAVGFASAGVAGLFLSTFVTAAMGNALPTLATLALSIVVALVGTVVTIRLESRTVAVLALLGALAAPIFGDAFRLEPLLTGIHLSVVVAIGLTLARRRPDVFSALRFFLVLAQGFLGFIWLAGSAWLTPALALVFLVTWWGMYIGEAFLAALRGTTPRANVVIAFLATLVASASIAPVLGELVPWQNILAYAPVAMALIAGVASTLLPNLSADDAGTAEEAAVVTSCRLYRSALRLIATLLIALALAPFLGAAALAVAWAGFAVVANEAERRGVLVGGRGIGTVVLLLALVAAFAAGVVSRVGGGGGWWTLPDDALLPRLGSLTVGPALVAFVAVSFGGVLFAGRASSAVPEEKARVRALPVAVALISLVAWALGCVASSDRWMTVILLAVAPAFLARLTRGALPIVGSLAAVIAMIAWAILETSDHGSSFVGVHVVSAAMIVGGALVVALRAQQSSVKVAGLVLSSLLMALAAGFIGAIDIGPALGATHADAIGFAAAAITVVALIVHLYASGLGGAALAIASVGQMIFAAILWAVATIAVPALERPIGAEPAFLHLGSVTALILIASAWVALQSSRRHEANRAAGRAVTVSLLALVASEVTVYLSREIARLIGHVDPDLVAPGLSLLWGVSAIALIAFGFALQRVVARWIGLATLGLVAVKVIAWDMRSTDTVLRVVIMLAVGLTMVVTSVVYVRHNQRRARLADARGETSDGE